MADNYVVEESKENDGILLQGFNFDFLIKKMLGGGGCPTGPAVPIRRNMVSKRTGLLFETVRIYFKLMGVDWPPSDM